MLSQNKKLIYSIILLLGFFLRLINTIFGKVNTSEIRLMQTLFHTYELIFPFRFISLIFSIIIGIILIITIKKYGGKDLFSILILFLFSISPNQILVGSTVNLFIYYFLISTLIILFLPRLSLKMIIAVIGVGFLSLFIIEYIVFTNKIHLLIDKKMNSLTVFDNSFAMMKKYIFPNKYMNMNYYRVGPHIAPLSLLAIRELSHCTFDVKSAELNIQEIYSSCGATKNNHSSRFGIDYSVRQNRTFPMIFFGHLLYFNASLADWLDLHVQDQLESKNRYDLFTLDASSLYLFSPSGVGIRGMVPLKAEDAWWKGTRRILISMDKQGRMLDYSDGINLQMHQINTLRSNRREMNIFQFLKLINNMPIQIADLIGITLIVFFLLSLFLVIPKPINVFFIIFYFLSISAFLVFPVTISIVTLFSIVFLYSNALSISYCLHTRDSGWFEVGLIVVTLLLCVLVLLPYQI